ncbi:SRPBCC family protein [Roseomonas terrae]|uniref:SRPBCC family protein n=1 Tax=Neoroseomonas terrae TaxID=424799 RepID=A0ABS5EL08_9PROT|nr:SRPBCC family protein [Neoroseomonas terrae]MBR0651716.1 SRPBCC family protein [Neoroseomonas terrae]
MDVNAQVAAVARSVSACERDGRAMRDVTVERCFGAPPGELWSAVTDPQQLARWFLPVSGELRLGGRYQFDGNAGGTITACEAPRHLVVTWEFGGGVSWVALRIAAATNGARVTLTHTCPLDDHWRSYGAGAAGLGWELALAGLAALLAGGTPPDESSAFVAAASDAWRRAAIAGGEDAAQAAEAAGRTTAFYAPPAG